MVLHQVSKEPEQHNYVGKFGTVTNLIGWGLLPFITALGFFILKLLEDLWIEACCLSEVHAMTTIPLRVSANDPDE